jgi:hypothetical protein
MLVAALAPQVPILLWLVGSAGLAAAHRSSLWREETLNPAEAMARGDYGQALRLIRQGDDPNGRYRVSGESSADPVLTITPLEAAVRRGDVEMVQVMFDHGALADDAERRRLSCLALTREAEEIAEFLIGRVPVGDECAGVHNGGLD